MNWQTVVELLKETFNEWNEDKASRLAAALAYHTIFSLAPLLIVAIAIAGAVFGEEAAKGEIVGQIQDLVGGAAAEVIQTMIINTNQAETGTFATIAGIATLLLGATGIFGELQDALNTIWEVAPKPGLGVMNFIRSRVLSFVIVLCIGLLLLLSLVISTALAAFSTWFNGLLPGLGNILGVLNFAISFGLVTLLLAAIYDILPDVKIAWKDVWIGAAATALLFTIGRTLLGIYLGSAAVGSTFGAAGSLVVIVVWIFYSAQILLFGAEFTKVYARKRGARIVPADNAIRLTATARVQQGIPRSQYVQAIAQEQETNSASDNVVTQEQAEKTQPNNRSRQSRFSFVNFLQRRLGRRQHRRRKRR
jgi:membrane protein